MKQLKKETWLANLIRQPVERKRVKMACSCAVLLLIGGAWYIPFVLIPSTPLGTRIFEETYRNIGSFAEYGFFFSIALFPFFWVIKQKRIGVDWKKRLQPLVKIIRQWHVPVGLLSIALAVLHGTLAILNGFQWDAAYLTGILSLTVLFALAGLGLLRYQRKDKNLHKYLGIAFVILFLFHTYM